MAEFAKYIGTATTRQISAADWEAAGIKNQKTLTFGRANGWTVPREDIGDEAWAKLVEDDGVLVVGEKGNPDAEYEARLEAARSRMRASAAAARNTVPEAPAEPEDL